MNMKRTTTPLVATSILNATRHSLLASRHSKALSSFWNFEGTVAVSEDPIAIFGEGFAAKFGDEGLGIREPALFDEPFEMHFRAMIKKAHPRILLFVFGERI